MSKAIYTFIGGKPYRIDQNTSIPTSMTFKQPGVNSNMNIDTATKAVTENVYMNMLKKPGTKSNAEMYKEFEQFLRDKKITEIPIIQNTYKVFIDYSIFDDGKEIDHSAIIRPIDPLDKVYLLGVATNNELVYRRVKTFNPKIDFKTGTQCPFGIIHNATKRYSLKINNIVIFEDFNPVASVNNSVYDMPYAIDSMTIQASVHGMMQIFSTEAEGIDIAPADLTFVPRFVSVSLEIILANYIVAYDHNTIEQILIENIENKYGPDDSDPDVPEDPENPGIIIPDEDKRPDADGDYTPDKNGYFAYYERCKETTPKALLVVEDLTPDQYYDISYMIKKSKVIKDIEDIEAGEYVIYRESFSTLL